MTVACLLTGYDEQLTLKNVHLEWSKSVISENVCQSRDSVDCGHVLRDVTAAGRLIIRDLSAPQPTVLIIRSLAMTARKAYPPLSE